MRKIYIVILFFCFFLTKGNAQINKDNPEIILNKKIFYTEESITYVDCIIKGLSEDEDYLVQLLTITPQHREIVLQAKEVEYDTKVTFAVNQSVTGRAGFFKIVLNKNENNQIKALTAQWFHIIKKDKNTARFPVIVTDRYVYHLNSDSIKIKYAYDKMEINTALRAYKLFPDGSESYDYGAEVTGSGEGYFYFHEEGVYELKAFFYSTEKKVIHASQLIHVKGDSTINDDIPFIMSDKYVYNCNYGNNEEILEFQGLPAQSVSEIKVFKFNKDGSEKLINAVDKVKEGLTVYGPMETGNYEAKVYFEDNKNFIRASQRFYVAGKNKRPQGFYKKPDDEKQQKGPGPGGNNKKVIDTIVITDTIVYPPPDIPPGGNDAILDTDKDVYYKFCDVPVPVRVYYNNFPADRKSRVDVFFRNFDNEGFNAAPETFWIRDVKGYKDRKAIGEPGWFKLQAFPENINKGTGNENDVIAEKIFKVEERDKPNLIFNADKPYTYKLENCEAIVKISCFDMPADEECIIQIIKINNDFHDPLQIIWEERKVRGNFNEEFILTNSGDYEVRILFSSYWYTYDCYLSEKFRIEEDPVLATDRPVYYFEENETEIEIPVHLENFSKDRKPAIVVEKYEKADNEEIPDTLIHKKISVCIDTLITLTDTGKYSVCIYYMMDLYPVCIKKIYFYVKNLPEIYTDKEIYELEEGKTEVLINYSNVFAKEEAALHVYRKNAQGDYLEYINAWEVSGDGQIPSDFLEPGDYKLCLLCKSDDYSQCLVERFFKIVEAGSASDNPYKECRYIYADVTFNWEEPFVEKDNTGWSKYRTPSHPFKFNMISYCQITQFTKPQRLHPVKISWSGRTFYGEIEWSQKRHYYDYRKEGNSDYFVKLQGRLSEDYKSVEYYEQIYERETELLRGEESEKAKIIISDVPYNEKYAYFTTFNRKSAFREADPELNEKLSVELSFKTEFIHPMMKKDFKDKIRKVSVSSFRKQEGYNFKIKFCEPDEK